MKRHSQILTGTALGLLMASAPLAALPLPANAQGATVFDGKVILAQATEETEEERLRREAEEAAEEAAEPAAEEPPAAGEPAAEEPAGEEPAAAEEPAPEAPAAAEEPAAAPEEPATAEEPAAAPDAPVTAEEPTGEPEAPAAAEEPVEEEPATAEEPTAPEEPATAEEPAAAPEEPVTAEEPVAEPEAPVTAEEPVEPEAPAAAEEPVEEDPAIAEEPEVQPETPATAEEPAVEPEEPATAEEPALEPDAPAAAEEPAAPEAPATAEEPVAPEDPATAEEEPAAPADGETVEGEPVPENAAPVLDSAKEGPAAEQPAEETAQPAEEPALPPASDAEAQVETVAPEEIEQELEALTADEGEQIDAGATREERRERRRERRERREDARVIEEYDDNRVIVEFNNQVFIESPDYDRIILDDDEVYYYQLPEERVREVVVRPNGVRVITVRNRYGDVIRRVRVLPNGQEVVLVWVPDRYYDEVVEFRDPAEYLPPLVLDIPRQEYILEAELVEQPEVYYEFLEQPPVEQVERIYSIEEVKYSARIRDKMRRVDLDTINFEFGSAEIAESEIDELEAIAQAMERMLEEDPGEVFLIEGHTDAVGTDVANLALSDRRAESVARALTNVFGIPPENLVTQGYGEQYLKIETEERERENRRVAIRRITPLVSPVASAQ